MFPFVNRPAMAPAPNGLATATAAPQGRQDAPAPTVPFVRASQRQTLFANVDVSRVITANAQQVGVFELPASGFLRRVPLLVTASGGDDGLTPAVAAADGPWSIIEQISLEDPSGRPIFGPVSGYELFLSNFTGGYTDQLDPATWEPYSAIDTNGDFRFLLYVPVEASMRDGYASLTNQDSSAAYRLRISMADETAVYATPPGTTNPTVRFQAWADLWTQPTATNLAGQPQQQVPPGSGTIQFWTREVNPIVIGRNTVRVKRVGNLFRNLVLITRTAAGARVASNTLPDPIRIMWDNLTLTDEGRSIRLARQESFLGGNPVPAGVYVYSFCDDLDGQSGFELRNALLPTTVATKLEIDGSFAAAGSLTVLINDILPVNLS